MTDLMPSREQLDSEDRELYTLNIDAEIFKQKKPNEVEIHNKASNGPNKAKKNSTGTKDKKVPNLKQEAEQERYDTAAKADSEAKPTGKNKAMKPEAIEKNAINSKNLPDESAELEIAKKQNVEINAKAEKDKVEKAIENNFKSKADEAKKEKNVENQSDKTKPVDRKKVKPERKLDDNGKVNDDKRQDSKSVAVTKVDETTADTQIKADVQSVQKLPNNVAEPVIASNGASESKTSSNHKGELKAGGELVTNIEKTAGTKMDSKLVNKPVIDSQEDSKAKSSDKSKVVNKTETKPEVKADGKETADNKLEAQLDRPQILFSFAPRENLTAKLDWLQ